jgi:hypothetical protein
VLQHNFALGPGDEIWDCPEPKRQEHVEALRSYLHAVLPLRGPLIRTLISTQSQSRDR